VPELIRPSPPLSWRDRAGGWVHVLRPNRLATAAGAVLLVATAGWWLLRSPASPVEDHLPMAAGAVAPATSARSTVRPAASSPATAATGRSAAAGPSPPATGALVDGAAADAVLVVQAAGEVARPGVYHLPVGSRVVDLVAAAGGPTPHANLDAVALASKLVDGQRVDVPAVGEPVPPTAAAGAAPPTSVGPTPEAPLDLNAATAEQLDELPGVGPATAQAIIAYRTKHGPLHSVDELLEVRGIGPAKFDQLRALVRV
jgi:competence protein ComEA